MASSSAIKGLTIEIGANTTKFTTALKDIEKDARDISKDLKTVNENLKLDSSSAEKSADKLKLLQDAAQNASKKVDLIKQAIQKLNEQEADKSTDKYKNALADLERQLTQADLRASQTAQNAFISQGFANEVDALYNRLNSCPVPTTPVYGRTPIFTCNNGCGCGNFNTTSQFI